MKMKILLVGSNKGWAIENIFKKELDKFAEVELFNAHGDFHDYYYKSLLNKLKYRAGLSAILKRINQGLLEKVDSFQPDAIWVFKGMEIFPKTIELLRQKNIKLANYNPDHPFKFGSAGSGNKNVFNSIELYDHHFCYSTQIETELKNNFDVETSWLPFAYKTARANDTNKLIRSVCFIGNSDGDRYRVIKDLLENEISVSVYGKGWEGYFKEGNQNLSISTKSFNGDFSGLVQEYAVQLNLFRNQNKGSHNLRSFEMPAMGCIMLAPDSEEHRNLFIENQEAFFFNDQAELIEKAKWLLSLGKDELTVYRNKAYQRSISSGYSYSDRAKHVFKTFEQLLSND